MGPHLARGRQPMLRHALDGLEAPRRAQRRRRDYVPRPSERKRRPRSCVGSKIKKTEGFLLPFGCLHSKGNNCTGKSQGLFAYRTSKGGKLIKSTDALIHFGYTRYFHYYRIQKVPEALCYDLVLKLERRPN